jgi:hypothetical protein
LAALKPSRWLPLFEEFVGDLRISSKETTSQDGKGVPLVLWESQLRFLREVAEGLDQGQKVFKCLKSRQLGVTTVSLAVDLFWAAMHPGITMALVTENEANRDKNRTVLKQYVNSFPEGYFGESFKIVADNRQMMKFSNGSRFDFKVAGTKDKGTSWGEGEGYAACHLTELASYGSADGLKSFEESFAQNNPDSIFLYESTAKGHNMWHDSWQGGFKDPHRQRSFFIGWWASGTNCIEQSDPRFPLFGTDKPDKEEREKIKLVKDLYNFEVSREQLAWYRYRVHAGEADGGMLDQNQPWTARDAFIMSGQSFFPVRQVHKDRQIIEDGGEDYGYLAYRYEFGNTFFDLQMVPLGDDEDAEDIELRVWEEPVAQGKYVIGCDPAYGRNDHKDQIAIQVFRCYADRLVQVAEYATYQVEVKYAAWVLAHLAGAYSDCIVNVELGGGGRIIMHEWEHLKMMINSEMSANQPNRAEWEDALSNARWYLFTRPDSMSGGYAFNFETTWRTKQELMHGMRGSYVTRELMVRSIPLLAEMMNVVQDGSTIGAPESSDPNHKDDRVFATAFAHRAWVNWRRPEMMMANQTWQVVTDEESGTTNARTRSLNGMVTRFWNHMAAQAGNDDNDQPTWRTERGL